MNKKKCTGYHGKCYHPNNESNWLPLTEFYKNKAADDGLKSYCKFCSKTQNDLTNPDHVTREYKKYPVPDKIIYGIVDNNKNIVYVGETKNGPKRLMEHLTQNCKNAPCREADRTGWSYVVIWDGTNHSKQDRLMLEAVLIQSLRPKYNKQWNQDD